MTKIYLPAFFCVMFSKEIKEVFLHALRWFCSYVTTTEQALEAYSDYLDSTKGVLQKKQLIMELPS